MPECPACGQSNPARARFCMSCAAPLPPAEPAPGGARKTVTVVFCDVAGSTPLAERLDPESVRGVMTRFFRRMRSVLEVHGGSVEKYIGDAVMAVFGIPLLHEDDALRAVRAADRMQAALAELNEELQDRFGVSLRTRIGVNTGEVVVGDPAMGQALVVGDAVNVAARLQQAASPGEVLIGDATHALVREHVRVGRRESLALKGKQEAVVAYRLLGVDAVPPPLGRREDVPFVGREHELESLRSAFERALEGREVVCLTILGAAGVGKSRLTREFLLGLPGGSEVFSARCLPYGDGITFWPVAELVKQACDISDDDSRESARTKIESALEGSEEGALIAERIAGVIGFGAVAPGLQETFWAIRRFLEWIGRERPLVVVFDDLQWAEPTLLDLLEYLIGWSRGVTLLLLCIGRPDLMDLRATWGSGKANALLLPLAPLPEEDSRRLIELLLGGPALDPAAAERIAEPAGGNPLFLEEMLRMLEDDGLIRRSDRADGGWEVTADLTSITVPASIQALLAARLDRLSAEERTVIRCASVIGRVFWWGAVAELAPEEIRPRVGGHLQTLVRKDLIRPERSTFSGEDAFRFHHLLIQEAAYRGTPKELRALLHERFAGWVERAAGERVGEQEEVIGFHLERAFRYRSELGPPDERSTDLAVRAAKRLSSAGRRAVARGDMPAASDLLGRAAELLPSGHPERRALLPELGEALSECGDLQRADAVLAEAAELAEAGGDLGLRAHATIVRLLVLESTDPKRRSEEALAEVEQILSLLEELGDDRGMARAYRLVADLQWTRSRYAAVDDALERAIEHARRAGAVWEEAESMAQYTGSGVYGPAPVAEVARRCERVLASSRAGGAIEARALRALASVRAMEGRFDEARTLARRAKEMLDDLGLRLRAAFVSETLGSIETLAGDHAAAERELRAGFEVVKELGERGFLSTVAALLARCLVEQGRLGEAERFVTVSREAAAPDDLATQVTLRGARARILAAKGRLDEAERVAAEAVRLAEGTDDLNACADTLLDQAEVLRAAGAVDRAAAAIDLALDRYERKGNVVGAALARRRRAELSR